MRPDAPERVSSVDDQATQREAQFTDAAVAVARRPVVPSVPGVCLNCGQQLANLAVYCDSGCRSDHEARLLAQRRSGRRG